MKFSVVVSLVLVVLFASRAGAWPTHHYSDAEVVGRAELIVLARIKVGSIQRIIEAGGYEHHAILIVSKTIKGECRDVELPVTISYGLFPVAAHHKEPLGVIRAGRNKAEEPGDATIIYEDNPSEGFSRPSGDVHQDQIWLLHRLGAPLDPKNPQVNPKGSIGIDVPEDLQLPAKEPALLKHSHAL